MGDFGPFRPTTQYFKAGIILIYCSLVILFIYFNPGMILIHGENILIWMKKKKRKEKSEYWLC